MMWRLLTLNVTVAAFLSACVSVRTPQLPQLDILLNPGDAPEMWQLSFAGSNREVRAIHTSRGIEFVGFQGELIWFDGQYVRQMMRFNQTDSLYTWKLQKRAGPVHEYRVFDGSGFLETERCTSRSVDGDQTFSSCLFLGKSQIQGIKRVGVDQTGKVNLIAWTHPTTGQTIELAIRATN